MDIVTLSAAGVACSGAARDEELCGVVADIMLDLGRRPIVCRKAKASRARRGIEVSRAVHNFRQDEVASLIKSGQWVPNAGADAAGDDSDGPLDLEAVAAPPQKRLREASGVAAFSHSTSDIGQDVRRNFAKANPAMSLPNSVHVALQKMTSRGCAALPLRHERKRATQSEPAGSVALTRLSLWLDTDAGKEWKRQRGQRVKENLQ
jgi:hypothetical protein